MTENVECKKCKHCKAKLPCPYTHNGQWPKEK